MKEGGRAEPPRLAGQVGPGGSGRWQRVAHGGARSPEVPANWPATGGAHPPARVESNFLNQFTIY